jgi:predicted amidohydrolase YtcJ
VTNKNTYGRRDFLVLAGAGVASLAGAAWPRGMSGGSGADLVVFNANVRTVDSGMPRAEAFAVKNGRFVAVGSSDDIKRAFGRSARRVDAERMTILPGFIDCHNHAEGETLLYEVLVGNPFEVEFVTIDSIVEKLRQKAAQTPEGTWVEGFFFDDTKVKDKRQLNVQDLDRVSSRHPVAVHHRGGHTAFYNSLALRLAGVTKDSPNPPGGTFDHDSTGELNGRVTDNALDIVDKAGTRAAFPSDVLARRRREGLAHISGQFVRYGLTSVHHEEGDLLALQQIRAHGDLKHRVSYEAGPEMIDSMIANGIETGFGDEWIRFGATSEHTVDGSFSERTMALSVPYPGREPPYQGNITEPQDVLDAWVERVHRAGIQPNCHANGDVAIQMVLSAYERAQRLHPLADVRPKITHCTLINDELVKRIKAAGAVPALFTSYAYYNSDKFHFYGQELMSRCMAFRSLLDGGVPAAAGSDFGPGPFAPLMGIQGMVTRTGWNGETWGANQRVTVEEAIRINTINGAYASHEESLKGSISVGKLADFVVLAEDPQAVDPARIKDIKVVRTVTGGNTVYEA